MAGKRQTAKKTGKKNKKLSRNRELIKVFSMRASPKDISAG